MMKMVKGVPPRQYFFSLKKIGRLVKRSLRLSVGLKSTESKMKREKTIEGKFKAMFTKKTILFGNLVPQPGNLLNTWEQDKEFARQFLNGVNPMMIQVVKDVDTQLTSEIVQFFATDERDHTIDLHALAEDKRLLFATYEDLMDLKKMPVS
jgi:adenylate cyclase